VSASTQSINQLKNKDFKAAQGLHTD